MDSGTWASGSFKLKVSDWKFRNNLKDVPRPSYNWIKVNVWRLFTTRDRHLWRLADFPLFLRFFLVKNLPRSNQKVLRFLAKTFSLLTVHMRMLCVTDFSSTSLCCLKTPTLRELLCSAIVCIGITNHDAQTNKRFLRLSRAFLGALKCWDYGQRQ